MRPSNSPDTLGLCRSDLGHVRKVVALYALPHSHPYLKLLDEILLLGQARSITIQPDEWVTFVTPSIAEMADNLRERWLALLRHCFETKNEHEPLDDVALFRLYSITEYSITEYMSPSVQTHASSSWR